MGFTRMANPSDVSTSLGAEFLLTKRRDWLVWPKRKLYAAMSADFQAFPALPSWVIATYPVGGSPVSATFVRAELVYLRPRRGNVLLLTALKAGAYWHNCQYTPLNATCQRPAYSSGEMS
jgi:hypothetical protein